MARVHTVVAAKDYPDIGVKKGETYYKWTPYRGGVHRSKTYPRPSQISTAKTAVIDDAIDDAKKAIEGATTPDDIETAMSDVATVARDVTEEYEEALNAWPNGNAQIEETRDNVESFTSELEGFSVDSSDFDAAKTDDEKEDALEDIRSEAVGVLENTSW